jgi:hypothetical protein
MRVYSFNEAWGKSEDETLIHNDIIIHLRKALDNWIAFENKSNAKQPAVPHIGSKLLLISTLLFLISSGNASSASTNILKLFVYISKNRLKEEENKKK